jgi:hypothetical protein
MKNRKVLIVIIAMSLICFIGISGNLIIMTDFDKNTDENTVMFSATVSEITINDTGEQINAEIMTNEYSTALWISGTVCENINIDDIRDINKNQAIRFRMAESKANQIDYADFLDIISLETESKVLFSLEDSNEFFYKTALPARIVSIVADVAILAIVVFCIVSLRRNGRSNQTPDDLQINR